MGDEPTKDTGEREHKDGKEESKGLRETGGLRGAGSPSDTAPKGGERDAPAGEG